MSDQIQGAPAAFGDGTVTGTAGDDLIDIAYLGDPDGDRVDAGDAILPGAAPDDDLILGLEGNDTVLAGVGDDVVFGGADDDRLYGEDGNDELHGDDGQDILFGGAGDDALFGGAGDDTLKGGEGDDLIVGGEGVDYLSGYDGRDTFIATAGDYVDGGAGGDDFDTLDLRGMGPYRLENLTPDSNGNGQNGTVVFLDVDGNPTGQTITFVEIENIIDDEPGQNGTPVANDDTAEVDEDSSVTIPVLSNDSDPDGDTLTVTSATAENGTVTINPDGTVEYTPNAGFTGTDTVTYTIDDGNGGTDTAVALVSVGLVGGPDGTVEGTGGDDLIDINYTGDPEGDRIDNDDAILPGAGPNDDLVYAFGGNDTVFAGVGNDIVYGGAGDDTLYGDEGDDYLIGNGGTDTLYGGDGNDELRDGGGDGVFYGGAGDDLIRAGNGNDTIFGGDGNDRVYGGAGDDVIDTRGGTPLFDNPYPPLPMDPDMFNDRDTVFGGAGNDTILTGDDRDTIFGGRGDDYIDAGIDDDLVYAGAGNDTVIGGEGNDTIHGGNGDDVIYGGLGPEFPDSLNIPDVEGDLVTDNGRDLIYGGAGNDTIFGLDDNDTIFGGAGDDTIDAGIDDDLVYGGDGNDTIIGGQGNDTLYGGFGSDTFIGGNGGDVVIGGEDPDDSDIDVLDLTGSGVDFITYTSPDREAGIVTFLDGSTMTFAEIENVIPCFTPGTTIATPKGERLVEELREGDRIITRDNGIQEIRWVGRKDVSGKMLVGSPHLRPVLIKAGALGNGLPERDMLVSPNHRVLVSNDRTQLYFDESEVLAAAKHLVGSAGIMELDVMGTSYIHFMFDRHEVVLSNGAWTESFQPGDYSLKGIGNAQRTEILELFPELKSAEGLEGYQSARKSLKKHEARLLVR